MALILDHFFILTGAGAPEAELLREIGLIEAVGNTHPGQGTANRRFFCANTMLELLYLRDLAEAQNGPGKKLRFAQRMEQEQASPFGLVFRATADAGVAPFRGWAYYPDYLSQDMHFLVGENSDDLLEPLCICMPDELRPPVDAAPPENSDWHLTGLSISVPVSQPSETLRQVATSPDVSIRPNRSHLLELDFNYQQQGRNDDFRPQLPLIIRH